MRAHLMQTWNLYLTTLGIMKNFLIMILIAILIVIVVIMQCTLMILIMEAMVFGRFVVLHGHVLNQPLVIGAAAFHCVLAVFDCVLVQHRFILYVLTAIMRVPALMKAMMEKKSG